MHALRGGSPVGHTGPARLTDDKLGRAGGTRVRIDLDTGERLTGGETADRTIEATDKSGAVTLLVHLKDDGKAVRQFLFLCRKNTVAVETVETMEGGRYRPEWVSCVQVWGAYADVVRLTGGPTGEATAWGEPVMTPAHPAVLRVDCVSSTRVRQGTAPKVDRATGVNLSPLPVSGLTQAQQRERALRIAYGTEANREAADATAADRRAADRAAERRAAPAKPPARTETTPATREQAAESTRAIRRGFVDATESPQAQRNLPVFGSLGSGPHTRR